MKEKSAGCETKEFRAVWIATVTNIDWPSKRTDNRRAKTEYVKLLDDVTAMGMNAVVVQIKPAADAFILPHTGRGRNT